MEENTEPLPDDALWLWLEIAESGVQNLEEDWFRPGLLDDDGPWSAQRVESALEALEQRGILSGERQILEPPSVEQQTAVLSDGAIVSVRVTVFSAGEVDFPAALPVESAVADGIAHSLVRSGRPVPYPTERALYWCSTEDGNEDWFVVAHCAPFARSFFEESEGYDGGYANAEWVADVPDGVKPADNMATEWPSLDVIRECGGHVLPYVPDMDDRKASVREQLGVVSQAVRFGDRVFVAGDLAENTLRREGGQAANSDH